MPGDNEFRFAGLLREQLQISYTKSPQNKCFRESVFNGSFGGIAGLTLGYIYFTNFRQAFNVGYLCTIAGFGITAAICFTNVQKAERQPATPVAPDT